MSDTQNITLYYVGDSPELARQGMPFDSIESAESYADDEGGQIYEVTATIDFSTMKLSGDAHEIPENDRTRPAYWVGYHYGMLMHFADGAGRDVDRVADDLASRAATYPGWTDGELFALFRNENELP